MIITAIVLVLLIAAGIIENALHRNRLARIPVRILVNGTRGKTSVSKIIVSALNHNGIKTIGRTTGSEASILLPDGTTMPFKRKFSPRITEIITFVRHCSVNNFECMVVECMALGAENQHVFSDRLLRPTHIAITNSHVDHIPEIGATEDETMWTLSRCLYPNSEVFCTEDGYEKYCKQAKSHFRRVLVRDYEGKMIESMIPVHNSNLSIAIDICNELGVSEEKVVEAVHTVVPDIGLVTHVPGRSGSICIMNFAVNDVFNMKKAVVDTSMKYGPNRKLCIIYNNRSDREYRLLHMRSIFAEHANLISHVYCIGDYREKISRFFMKRCGVKASAENDKTMYDIIQTAKEDTVFLGLGNIKGSAESIVRLCLARGDR